MDYDARIKKGDLIRRAGLVALLGGFGTFGYGMYQISENAGLVTQKVQMQQQVFECVEKGTTYDEATKAATIPQECYTKLQEYKAFSEKPETKEAIEKIQFYQSPLIQYGSVGLVLLGMIMNTTGRVMKKRAELEKEKAAEKDDEDDE